MWIGYRDAIPDLIKNSSFSSVIHSFGEEFRNIKTSSKFKRKFWLFKMSFGTDSQTEKLVAEFKRKLEESPMTSVGLHVISILSEVIAQSDSNTFMGLKKEIDNLTEAISKACPRLPHHFDSAVQVFCAGLSKASESFKSDWKSLFIARSSQVLADSEKVLNVIPDVSSGFLQHGMTLLTRGFDSMVASSLMFAASDGRQFHVIVTEGRPFDDGSKMAMYLSHPNLKVTVIPDAAVAQWMNEVDALLLGTDIVSEDGGLFAPVGTFAMCALASIHKKPVYVVCETFKFMRKFFLTPGDISSFQRKVEYKAVGVNDNSIECEAREFDFTPPRFVTLLLTEKGPIPTTAVTHELTKLHGVS